MKFYCHISFIVRLSKYFYYYLCPNIEGATITCAPVIKKMRGQRGVELTPSLKLSVSNPTPSAATLLLFLVMYEINIVLIHSLK
jgi:hypothetical protein